MTASPTPWTPGPWNWNVSLKTWHATLESLGRGRMLETVMGFTRWGMGGAAPTFRNERDIMVRVDTLTATVPGREHHADWYRTVNHPDARLIASAPELYEALEEVLSSKHSDCFDRKCGECSVCKARTILRTARGETP